jgi:hypothetical protein
VWKYQQTITVRKLEGQLLHCLTCCSLPGSAEVGEGVVNFNC